MNPAKAEAPAENPRFSGRVLHIWHNYGSPYSGWIHRLLSHCTRWRPHLLTRRPRDPALTAREYPWPDSAISFLPEQSRLTRHADSARNWLSLRCRGRASSAVTSMIRDLQGRLGLSLVQIHSKRMRYWDYLEGVPLPKAISFYGSDIMQEHGPGHQRRLRRLLQQETRFICTSEALRRQLQELGASLDRIHVVPVGIDSADFPPEEEILRRRGRKPKGDLRIVTVGRLVAPKAPQRLPEVARLLADRGLQFRWTLVGDGELRAEVEEGIRRHGVRDRFEMTGRLPFSEVRSLLIDADLMVHNAVVTPRGGRESLGVVLMEAGAMALPVVSCKVGGIPEVVVNGETGILVDEGDLQGMADGIAELAGDDDLRDRLGRAAMKRTHTTFDSAALAARLETLYDEII